jgi:S-adenosylmethionine hydrolase
VNRLQNSEASYTFHGRDVYAYTGARLAAGVISFEQVGAELPPTVVSIPYQKPVLEGGVVKGNIPILDVQYGNVWTNIDRETFDGLSIDHGDLAQVTVTHGDSVVLDARIPYQATFGAVTVGQPLVYLNSLNNVALALNQGSFASQFGIQSGSDWAISISPVNDKGQQP